MRTAMILSIMIMATMMVSADDTWASPPPQLRVCGNYCGPDWCANQVKAESTCVADGSWSRGHSDGGCADNCCRAHDYCCGAGVDRPSCNKQIVSCLSGGCLTSTCGLAVWTAMSAVKNWCCGSPCPKAMLLDIIELAAHQNITLPPLDPSYDP